MQKLTVTPGRLITILYRWLYQNMKRKFFIDSFCVFFSIFLDDTTINPVPVFGEYTWTQIMTSNSTLGIVVNASASSDLPFVKLNITVTLDSEGQSQVFNMPMEWANFTFDGLDLEPKDYLLSINFTSIDNESDGLLAATNTFNETIRTKAPTPTPTSTSTQAPSKGDKPFACHFLFLVFLAMFVLM